MKAILNWLLVGCFCLIDGKGPFGWYKQFATANSIFSLKAVDTIGDRDNNRPNVLFLVIDDLAPVLGSYDGRALTPNIDQLADQSIRFTNAYSQQPVCAPSRVSFLTGRRPDTTKTYYNRGLYWRTNVGNFTTLPQFLKEAGYFTASIGKVFHNAPVCGKHDDSPYSWSVLPYHAPTLKFDYDPVCPGADGKLHFNLLCPVNISTQPLGSLPDIQNADHILEIFQNLSRARENAKSSSDVQPFFLAMGFHKPHISLRYPEEYLGLYPLESIDIAPNAFYSMTQPPVAWDPFMDIRRREDISALQLSFPYGPVPDKCHYLIRQSYYAATTFMDYELGRVLAGLEKAGFAENTIITFISDHGWQLGEHQEWSKYSNYATATRVPMMIHIPGVTNSRKNHGQRSTKFHLRDPFQLVKKHPRETSTRDKPVSEGLVNDALVELVDMFPTVVDLVNLPVPPLCPEGKTIDTCVEGISLSPLITDSIKGSENGRQGIGSWKKAAFTQYPRPSDKPRPDSDQPTLANITIMGYSMITNMYHYTEWIGFNNVTCQGDWTDVHARELYVLLSDPLEDINVADESGYSDIVQVLSTELQNGWRHALPSYIKQ